MPSYDSIQYGSRVVNGQLIPVLEWGALASGNAVGPAWGGGPASPATIPPAATGGGSQTGAAAAASPWSLTQSPLPILIIMLIIGILGLRYVHWRS